MSSFDGTSPYPPLRKYATRLALLAAAVLSLLGPVRAAATTTYMSCGYPPVYDSYFGDTLDGHINYRRHPRKCDWSEDGSTANLINLVKIRWSHWGKGRAYAHAMRVDNHDMDHNGFQRHHVRIILYAPRPAFGHPGKRRQYYTKLRIFDQGRTGVESLFRPGEAPVVLPEY